MSGWIEREEDLENELNRGALWAVTYGDVMSYLMIFFLLMFAFTYNQSVKGQFQAVAVENQFGKGDAVQELFSKRGIQQIARIEVFDDRIRISFLSPVLFDEGFAELKETSKPLLNQLVGALKDLPNPIQIEGHTDNTPPGPHIPFKTNWELSAARAFSVLQFFLKAGLPPRRLAALGYGEFQPKETNDTPAGRAGNRRIEVNIMRRAAAR